MATWKSANSMLTSVGVEILNKLKSGNGTMSIAKVVIGSTSVEPSQLYRQTSVKGSTKEMIISNSSPAEREEDGNTIVGSDISFYINNKDFTSSFDVRQIGVFVNHTDYAEPVLYHISQCEEEGHDEIPAFSDTPVTLNYSLFLEHGNSSNVTINVNPEGMLPATIFDNFKKNAVVGEFLTVDSNGNLAPSDKFTNFKKNAVQGKLLTVDAQGNLTPTDVFDNFVKGAEANKLLTVDNNGNLIVSGKNTVVGKSFSITNAIDHRALSISIEGHSTQSSSPTPANPVYPVYSTAYGMVLRNTVNMFDVQGNLLKNNVAYGISRADSKELRAYVTATGSELPYLGYLMPIEIGKSYTITYGTLSGNIMSCIQLDKPVYEITPNEYGSTFTSGYVFTASKPFLLVCCHPNSTTYGTTFGFTKVQVEEGSVATTYTQFSGKSISFPSPIELYSVGDYKDTIEWDGAKWWKVQRIQEVVMDGTVNTVNTGSGNTSATACRYALTKASNTLITDCLPDAPVLTSHGNATHPDDTAEFYAFYYSSNGAICGHFLKSTFGISSYATDGKKSEILNNWLTSQNTAGTPLKVWYVLDTPKVTELTLSEVPDMYSNLTNIVSASTGNKPDMRLGYALNTTDSTTMYILKSLARKSEVSTANTFAVATLI